MSSDIEKLITKLKNTDVEFKISVKYDPNKKYKISQTKYGSGPNSKVNNTKMSKILYTNEATIYIENNLINRTDVDNQDYKLPAVKLNSGTNIWFEQGLVHRNETDQHGNQLPAITGPDHKEWWVSGQQHRQETDPKTGLCLPAVILPSGRMEWWCNGLKHRNDINSKTGLQLMNPGSMLRLVIFLESMHREKRTLNSFSL